MQTTQIALSTKCSYTELMYCNNIDDNVGMFIIGSKCRSNPFGHTLAMDSFAECTGHVVPAYEQYPDWSKTEVSTGVRKFQLLLLARLL